MEDHSDGNAVKRCGKPDHRLLPCVRERSHEWGECVGVDPRLDYSHNRFSSPVVQYKILGPGARIPQRSHDGDAGWDLYVSRLVVIPPMSFVDVHTDIAFAPPPGIWLRVVGRSSTVRNRGLLVIEGIIDTGWRGEILFGVRNLSDKRVTVEPGDRLAQVIMQQHVQVGWERSTDLPQGDRGNNGFGSTGR